MLAVIGLDVLLTNKLLLIFNIRAVRDVCEVGKTVSLVVAGLVSVLRMSVVALLVSA